MKKAEEIEIKTENEISSEEKLNNKELNKENQKDENQNDAIPNEENQKDEIKKSKSKGNHSYDLVKDKPKKKHNKILIAIISIFIIAILLLLSTVFALINSNSNTIISGVSVKGIDVSGLTKEEAYKKINNVINKKITSEFNLIYQDSKSTIVPEQFDAHFDINSSIDTAFERGRNDNIFKDNFEILSSLLFKVNIIPSFAYNEDFINTIIAEIQNNLPGRLVEPSYYIDGDNLIITKGVDGVTIDSSSLKLKIISNLNDFDNDNKDIELPIINSKASAIDIDKIYSEVRKDAKDAYYTKEPFTVYPHEVGIDFAISIEEAKKLLEEDKESYSIPLKITMPNITTAQIGTEAFPDLLATYSTTYSTRNVNRSTNIRLASSKINGIVVMPGQTFSYNSTVGKRTAAAGFKEAGVYSGGEVTTGIGGGICQVSSTLYNSVLLSNLQIVERYNHGFNPGYVPAGRDATVSWGGPDFKFKNNRNYPIRISCDGSGGTITVKIYGLREENEYEVEIQSYITSYIKYKTINKEDSSLASGQTKVLESGSNGCKSVCYRILKQNGQVVSKTLLSQDTYSPHNRIVAVGTKSAPAVQEPTTPTSTNTTTEEPTTPAENTNSGNSQVSQDPVDDDSSVTVTV